MDQDELPPKPHTWGGRPRLRYPRDVSSLVIVPNAIGCTPPKAESVLAVVGLRAYFVGAGQGVVVNQSPAGGAQVPEDSTVSLFVR